MLERMFDVEVVFVEEKDGERVLRFVNIGALMPIADEQPDAA